MLDPKKQSAGLSAGDTATAPGGARPSHGGATAKLQVGLLYLAISAGSVLYAVSICAVQSAVQGVPETWLRCSVRTCTYALLCCSFEHRDKAAFARCLGAVMFSAAAQDESCISCCVKLRCERAATLCTRKLRIAQYALVCWCSAHACSQTKPQNVQCAAGGPVAEASTGLRTVAQVSGCCRKEKSAL